VPTQQDIPRLLALRETRRRGGLARNQNAALTEIERRFQQIAEPAAAMATGMLAEPVSGIVGMAALPFGVDVAANAVRKTQQGLTYQTRTEAGQQGMQALQGFMQPIAETVSRQTDIASKVLAGNAGFDVNTPGGQFLTGMLPALAASAPGFAAARAIPGRRFEMGDIGSGGVGSRQRGAVGGIRSTNIPNAPEGRVMNAQPGAKLTFVETPDGKIQMYSPVRKKWKDVTDSPMAENIKIKDAEINAAGGPVAYQANIDNINARRKEVTVEQRAEANRLRDGLDYKMQHTAPKLDDNPPISNVEDAMPGVTKGDALRMYGTGAPYDAKALRVIQRMQGKPDADVTVYRAVPDGVKDINSSDWVTTTREYARDHIGNDKGYKILSKKVKAKDLAFDGNSIHEFGYDPRGDTVK
jgi:hypothetical protein